MTCPRACSLALQKLGFEPSSVPGSGISPVHHDSSASSVQLLVRALWCSMCSASPPPHLS